MSTAGPRQYRRAAGRLTCPCACRSSRRPMPFDPTPLRTTRHPVSRHPSVADPGRAPVAWRPDIGAMAPLPVARVPDIAATRRRNGLVAHRRGCRRCDHDRLSEYRSQHERRRHGDAQTNKASRGAAAGTRLAGCGQDRVQRCRSAHENLQSVAWRALRRLSLMSLKRGRPANPSWENVSFDYSGAAACRKGTDAGASHATTSTPSMIHWRKVCKAGRCFFCSG